ncbi:MAG TPA: hypothetical protein VGX68_18795 [Thermoanaerobaculia bacterium]|jgi:hypothetical protein|nr:hypothetical protein [Thermoanaerobaculia bacterium]
MTKRLCVTLVGVFFALSAVAGAQERPTRSGAAIEKALINYVRQMDEQAADPGLALKAVPRADKAEAIVIGSISFVDGTDFLSDGTPFRIVVVHAKKPFNQDVFIVCLGSSFNNSCGRLALGRRASFTTDVLVIEDGDNAGLALFVVKKLVT